jgi:hypothetical protein
LVAPGCGGGTTSPSDAGLDLGIDAPPMEDGGTTGDVGPDAPAIDVGTDAFVAVDAAPPFDPACIAPAIMAAADADIPIPTMSGSSGMLSYVVCPSGSDATANPKVCIEETRLGAATLTPSVSATQVTLTGTMPFRAADVLVNVNIGICTRPVTFATNGDGSCPAGGYDALPISIAITIDAAENDALGVNMLFDDAAVGANFQSSTQRCGVSACSATCCITDSCSCAFAGLTSWSTIESPLLASMISELRTSLGAQVEAQICATGTCPTGTTADAASICRYPDGRCAPGPALFRSGC